MSYDIDRAVRAGMTFSAIVDINGVMNPKTGGFHVVQDAIDAGHKSIFVRVGTYPGFDIDQVKVHVYGENSGDVIFDGGVAEHAILLSSNGGGVVNLACKTTAGGGQSYDALRISGGQDNIAQQCSVLGSDNYGIITNSGVRNRVIDCYVNSSVDDISIYPKGGQSIVRGCQTVGGTYGCRVAAGGTDSQIIGNNFNGASTSSITLDASANDCVVDGNKCDGAITDNSTGSTIGDNDESAY